MDPVAFSIGGFPIHWYGILAALGFLGGFHLAARRGRLRGLAPRDVMDLGPWILLGAMAGARTWYLVQEGIGPGQWRQWINIREGGLVWYGGLFGAVMAALIYAGWRKIPLWRLADALAPSIPLGHALGRLGCLMTGCCYGRLCDLPWAIQFPPGHETHPDPVHPVQIYQSLINFGLYFLLAGIYRRSLPDGCVFALYLMTYAVARAFADAFRGDHQAFSESLLSPGQWTSLLVLPAGAVLFLWFRRRNGAPGR